MIGTRLAHYDITAHLGAGGMGDVYQALDSRLGRSVAIKLLPEAFTDDADRVARFEREARVLASLNHPNIAGIHGIDASGGRTFLVMELVPGETLGERVGRGPIPIGEALPLALEIAQGLEAAHEKGIIHRDLKPGNIKVTPDGALKILDFGLAKAYAAEGVDADVSNSPTLSPAATMHGAILGTAAYMSPEQAKGRAVDKRTDIFAFGCVLYEMLTGRPAFEGEDVVEIMGAVVKTEPDWTRVPVDVPPSIRKLLRQCLEKDTRNRKRDAGDLALDIRQVIAGPQDPPRQGVGSPSERPFWKRPAAAAALLSAGALLAVIATSLFRPAPSPPGVTRFDVALGSGQAFSGLGFSVVAISPDGRQFVYLANDQLYLRRMGEFEATAIPGAEGALRAPVFSPDGREIVFYSGLDRSLKRMAVTGGAAIALCQSDPPPGISWDNSGILFAQGDRVMRISPAGGSPETLTTAQPDEVVLQPQLLPGGKSVLFAVTPAGTSQQQDVGTVVVQGIGSSERKILIEGTTSARYVPTGHIVYAFSGTLRAVAFDAGRLQVTSSPIPVAEGVRRSNLAAHYDFSSTGSLVYLRGPASPPAGVRFALFDRQGQITPLKVPPGPYSTPRVSRDGKQLAYQSDTAGESIIWIYDLAEGASARRLTFGGKNGFPAWLGNDWVSFQSSRDGDLAIFRQRADGSGTAERLTTPEPDAAHIPYAWSPDGKTLLVEVRKGASGSLWTFSIDDKQLRPFGNVENRNPIDATFSPDGRWVAYTSQETGRNEVFVQPFPATGAKYQIPNSADNHAPLWLSSNELYYLPGPGRVAAVRLLLQPGFSVSDPVTEFSGAVFNAPSMLRQGDVMPDGKHIIGMLDARVTEIESGPDIRVVLDWFSELQQRVPAK